MGKLIAFLLILLTFDCGAQQVRHSDIQAVGGLDSIDMYRFMSLLELEASKYVISQKFKDYDCNLIVHEYREGRLVGKYNLADTLRRQAPDHIYTISVEDGQMNGKFEVAIYSQKMDSVLKIDVLLGRAGFNRKLRIDKNAPYSWKEVFSTTKHELKPGELFPLLTYSKPLGAGFSRPGVAEFCRVGGEMIPYEKWYKELGIDHYFIFFVLLEK